MVKIEINRDKAYSSSEIIKILEADGWQLNKVEGSHHQFKHNVKKGKVTVKHPDKELSPTYVKINMETGRAFIGPLG